MDQKHKIWAVRAGIGGGICALLTVWMVPDTTPTARPSVIAGMAATAEAQKPTYSAVPDSAIPSWAGSLRQVPSAAAPPVRVADSGPRPDADPLSDTPDEPTPPDNAPAPPVMPAAETPSQPATLAVPTDSYQTRRAEWQARLDTVMQGQGGPS